MRAAHFGEGKRALEHGIRDSLELMHYEMREVAQLLTKTILRCDQSVRIIHSPWRYQHKVNASLCICPRSTTFLQHYSQLL